MKKQSWVLIDKGGWLPGPWRDEPDKIVWWDALSGYPCMILRTPQSGAWCGYVGIPPWHQMWRVPYGRCARRPRCWPSSGIAAHCHHKPEDVLGVHGGVTYSGGGFGRLGTPEQTLAWYAQASFTLEQQHASFLGDYTPEQMVELYDMPHWTGHEPKWLARAWWFGFDCAHAGDIIPGMDATLEFLPTMPDDLKPSRRHEPGPGNDWFVDTYANVDYVTATTAELAAQLRHLETERWGGRAPIRPHRGSTPPNTRGEARRRQRARMRKGLQKWWAEREARSVGAA